MHEYGHMITHLMMKENTNTNYRLSHSPQYMLSQVCMARETGRQTDRLTDMTLHIESKCISNNISVSSMTNTLFLLPSHQASCFCNFDN